MGIFSRWFGRKKITEEKIREVQDTQKDFEIRETEKILEDLEVSEVQETLENSEIPETEEILETSEPSEVEEVSEVPDIIEEIPEIREGDEDSGEGPVSEAVRSNERLQQVMKKLKEKTLKPAIHMELNRNPVGLTDSKLGGIPYLSEAGGVPEDGNGHQLRLLAQIRLEDLPENKLGLPEEGLLQFWVLDDARIGLETDLDQMLLSKGHRVLWYPTVEEGVTEAAVMEKYHFYMDEESYFPVQDVFGIKFTLAEESLSYSDYRFQKAFAELWNTEYPSDEIRSYEALDEEIPDEMMDEIGGSGHKLGGYPMFTQWDPREGRMENYEILLLQIDSFGTGCKEIMWGDSGVGNFFITPEDLANRDFSKVLYSWDCY